jgi:hypothetical protein
MFPLCHLLVINVLTFIVHAANHRQAGDDCCKAAPLILVVYLMFCQVTGARIRVKTGHLHQRPVVMGSVFDHVTLEKANTAAVNPVSHPNSSNRHLLPPLNHDLHLPKPDHHVWLHQLATVDGTLFARAAPVPSLSAKISMTMPGG